MSDAGWLGVFTLIFLLMAGVTGWMVWFSRRAMRSHRDQIEHMIREMRETVEEQRAGRDDRGKPRAGRDDRSEPRTS